MRDIVNRISYRIGDYDQFLWWASRESEDIVFRGFGNRRDQPAMADRHVQQEPFEYPAFNAGSTVQEHAVVDGQQGPAAGKTAHDIMNISGDMINVRAAFAGSPQIAENIGRRSPGKRGGPLHDGHLPANEWDNLPEDQFYTEEPARFPVQEANGRGLLHSVF